MCVHSYVYACAHISRYTYVHMYVPIYDVYINRYIFVYILECHVHMYAGMYVYINIHAHCNVEILMHVKK
jgi:hypothetical protein